MKCSCTKRGPNTCVINLGSLASPGLFQQLGWGPWAKGFRCRPQPALSAHLAAPHDKRRMPHKQGCGDGSVAHTPFAAIWEMRDQICLGTGARPHFR